MFKVYLTKESIKDSWNDGEYEEKIIWTDDELVASGDTVEDCFDTIFKEEIWGVTGEWRNNISPMNDEPDCITLLFCQTENCSGVKATEEQIEEWKAGKCDLFAAYYFFRVEETKILNVTDFKELPLAK